ncbi:hypothetical protein C1752_03190 [Acaryochloris thomasi RCC1774]|uniref:DUF302 domain-containing protein n=1 Tax=Acaryochloris thomasi RCC1774 TaxID=1764569 RepID=A0A2W1JHM8_9CYAN|nr:DUF302 domain-containing protein [Acaryochloris thomasi]PZD72846.1 hypothetical protein C1752_03190 [Acaryochloris thomasi RCC1774]
MHRLISIALGSTLLLISPSIAKAQTPPNRPSISDLEATGLVIKPSPYSVQETAERLTKVLEAKGLRIFTTIDHSENAAQAGLTLAATQVILFGNPKLGTPLMQCSPSVAIDLPQKVLIWETAEGVQLAYNNPAYLSGRHRLRGCGQEVVAQISKALNGLTDAALKAD